MARRQGRVEVDANRCKACGLCMEFCPKDCFEKGHGLNPLGFVPIRYREDSDCTACGNCAWMCPDMALRIWALDETAAAEASR
jgi:2-oxoglutarate ferredoxin oxidoreductase subunit delta